MWTGVYVYKLEIMRCLCKFEVPVGPVLGHKELSPHGDKFYSFCLYGMLHLLISQTRYSKTGKHA